VRRLLFALIVLVCFAILLGSCASIQKKTKIIWPEKIDSVEAICNLQMSWRDFKYSGTMALKIKYPDTFYAEIYGPFGETNLMIDKKRGSFLFISRDETIKDEKVFNDLFGITLDDFIEDITLRHRIKDSGKLTYNRKHYVVIYELDNNIDRICWKGIDGSICLDFIEADFNGQV